MISKTELKTYNYVLYFPILSFIIPFIISALYYIINLFSNIEYPSDITYVDFTINPGCFILQLFLFGLFAFSASQIKQVLKGKNSKMFIGLAKCSVGCSLVGIYLGFLLINAHLTSDIINNIIVLITSLFFFIDGTHDIYDYIGPKKPDINNTYIKKRAIKYEILRLFLFDAISIICIISLCYGFRILHNTDEYLVVSLILSLSCICAFLDLCILPFKDVFINIIASEESPDIKRPNNELPKKGNFIIRFVIICSTIVLIITNLYNLHTNVILVTLPLLITILLIAKLNFTRNWFFNTILNKIFEKVILSNDIENINSTKDRYYNQYIKSKPNMILLSDLKSNDCIWYKIINQKDDFLGHAFILNKNNQSYLFVFIINRKRGQGFGSIALSKLKQEPEVKHKDELFIQVKDDNKNIDIIRSMLNNNDFIEVITETPDQSDII